MAESESSQAESSIKRRRYEYHMEDNQKIKRNPSFTVKKEVRQEPQPRGVSHQGTKSEKEIEAKNLKIGIASPFQKMKGGWTKQKYGKNDNGQKNQYDKAWNDQLEALKMYKEENGDCLIPKTNKNRSLANWVKNQRYEYTLRQQGKKTRMTDARIADLNAVGFIWKAADAKKRNPGPQRKAGNTVMSFSQADCTGEMTIAAKHSNSILSDIRAELEEARAGPPQKASRQLNDVLCGVKRSAFQCHLGPLVASQTTPLGTNKVNQHSNYSNRTILNNMRYNKEVRQYLRTWHGFK
jgi:hypothetical protein